MSPSHLQEVNACSIVVQFERQLTDEWRIDHHTHKCSASRRATRAVSHDHNIICVWVDNKSSTVCSPNIPKGVSSEISLHSTMYYHLKGIKHRNSQLCLSPTGLRQTMKKLRVNDSMHKQWSHQPIQTFYNSHALQHAGQDYFHFPIWQQCITTK